MTLSEELRSKKSRDNRTLLDRAADRIDELEGGRCPHCGGRLKVEEEEAAPAKKHFTREDVRKMTRAEVIKHFPAILESMATWS